MLLLLMGIAVVSDLIKESLRMHHFEFEESIDDIENDVGGMVLAFMWTMTVRFAIVGSYSVSGEPVWIVWRGLFLLYVVLMGVLAFFLFPVIDRLVYDPFHNRPGDEESMHEHHTASARIRLRLLLLCYPFLTMSVAWGVLLWAEMEFYGVLFAGSFILGRAVFALLCSYVCFSLIVVFGAYFKHKQELVISKGYSLADRDAASLDLHVQQGHEQDVRKFLLNMLALLIAFSWEETFDAAIEESVPGHGPGHAAPMKLLLSFLTMLIALPVYAQYLRPHVEQMDPDLVGGEHLHVQYD